MRLSGGFAQGDVCFDKWIIRASHAPTRGVAAPRCSGCAPQGQVPIT